MQKYSVNQFPISILLSWVESEAIAIPEIQRPFVWSSTKVRDLMDSLYKGYPIGYIITWKNPDVRSKDGKLSDGRKVLIDGQQRITALMAAVLGRTVIDKNYKEGRIVIAFNPVSEEFATRTPAISKNSLWIDDISNVLSKDASLLQAVSDYIAANPEVDRSQIEMNFTKLVDMKNKPVGVIDLEGDLDIETVTEIFIRINSKGVVLSQADFAMSKIASYGLFGINLRKLIDYFCHLSEAPQFYKHISENDHEFSETGYLEKISWLRNESDTLYDPSYSDLIRVAFMKEFQRGKIADLVSLLSGRDFEQRIFTTEIAEESYKKLEHGVLAFANEFDFKQYLMIIRSTGFIDRDLITARNALNFTYMLYLHMREQKIDMSVIQKTIRRWFVASIITSRYTSSSETVMDADIRAIARKGAESVLKDIEDSQLSDNFWSVSLVQELDKASVRNPLLSSFWASQIKAKDRGFLSSHITVSDMIEQRGDIHHIFPADYLKKKGFDQYKVNQIANFVYAETWVNIRISNKAPDVYFEELLSQVEGGEQIHGAITSKDDLRDNLKENCIPESVFNMTEADYDTFLAQRRKLIAAKIKAYYKSL
jgi:hypothetical protein